MNDTDFTVIDMKEIGIHALSNKRNKPNQTKTLDDYPVLLTVKQVANITSCSEKHIRDCLKEGSIRGIKVGNVWRIGRDALFNQLGLISEQNAGCVTG